ncbi:hypothetical protein B7494_g7578 [Chlorociboria aeruginascens]|nr:hypothetical protein B7494_g7578 [Chlorociboria aeruginascens]
MEIWGSGFNAWNQLQFEGPFPSQPSDLKLFNQILADETIEFLRSSSSATLVRTSSGLRLAGSPDDFIDHCLESQDGLKHIAIAGNDKIAEFTPDGIRQYSSFRKYIDNDSSSLGEFQNLKQVVANQTSFTALSSDGTVLTWGDGSPASEPSVVEDLLDLPTGPIIKVSSGGYVTAALTLGKDLYVWGGRPGESKMLEQLTGSPTPVDLDGRDVLDMDVGINHMIALTTDHKVFGVGSNSNGQLGVEVDLVEDWKEIILPLSKNQKVFGVKADYKNSFFLVDTIK